MARSNIWKVVIDLQKKGNFLAAQSVLGHSRSELSDSELAECLGNQSFISRKFQEAIHHYERAITLDPEHIIARYQYLAGIQEHKAKNYVGAFNRFVMAIENEPDFVDPYVELGAMLMTVDDPKGALKCFEDALALEPKEIGNYYNIVSALQELTKEDAATYSEKLKEALISYDEAKKRLPAIIDDRIHEIPKA